MYEERIDKILSGSWLATSAEEALNHNTVHDGGSIQLQSPEAIALNGLLSDLEFLAKGYQSMAEHHWSNYKGEGTDIKYSREQSYTAFGIYSNKAQDMRDLVDKWKPNKK